MIRIFGPETADTSGEFLLEVEVDDTSYRHREVMGEDCLTLKFSLAEHVELPVGAWCEFMGERYALARPGSLTMHHSRSFDYTLVMEGAQWRAGIWKFRDLTDGRVSFSLTAAPLEHLQLFVDNMNDRAEDGDDEWVVGECIEGAEACVSYDHAYCIEALEQMADAFGTEYEFGREYDDDNQPTGRRTVSLRKVEYGRDDPLELSYGRGNGFKPDVGRGNSSDDPPVEILYAQGGSDNIDMSKYPQEIHRGVDPDDPDNPDNIDPKTGKPYEGDGTGNEQNNSSSVLLLPPGREIAYDGETFFYKDGGEWGYDPEDEDRVRRYVVDGKGYSVRRSDRELDSKAEDSLDCSDIYPKRVGTVAEVVTESEEDNFYDFIDPEINFNYNDYIIGTDSLSVIFQSGNLAGREFDVTYFHEKAGNKAARRFEVVPQEIDGVVMPDSGAFSIQPEDTYAVFNCMVPAAYICQDSDHSGAEWDMLRECVRYLYGVEGQRYTITGKMDGIWSRGQWDDIGPKVRPGWFVLFTDERFEPDGLLIRITGVKDYINSPQSPELELSNETVRPGLAARERIGDSKWVGNGKDFDDARARVKRLLRPISEAVGELEDEVDGDDGLRHRVEENEGAVAEVETAVFGAEGVAGIASVVATLQDAVTAINEALTETVDAVNGLLKAEGEGEGGGHGEIGFDPQPVEGETGDVRQPNRDD